ncbi:MAG: OsmC family protein [Drouetiella hepatica Uher 2000/2452]|jgi:organic hydroperoxide reductase OsmC/OhrA|uniref:OsmC family protein n=1 Tax=Drouetiella hepatica Uher 2000/2452 TaxID=904376 RepID=A0A951UR79_9CYAN|nr:OsmC family protein [Drouetiella hepatica Uher 2000/2452]
MVTPSKIHQYQVEVRWTGNTGQGTASYQTYDRAHEISVVGKPSISGSADPQFRGDPARYNPEELLVASISTCHMLWYLHLCTDAKIVVTKYVDNPIGFMIETNEGGGRFTEVILKPIVTLTADSDLALANRLHDKAHHLCFIANSMNFPIRCESLLQT